MKARYTITEIHNIRDILKQVNNDTWVIFDLDNTVIEPFYLSIGSDQWFTMMCSLSAAKIPDPNEALALTLALYYEIQHRLHMQLVEHEVAEVIDILHGNGVPVLALTSRGIDLKETTYRQLKNLNIHFEHDIIFCSGKNKGVCLQTYLESKHYKPAHIMMIDDKKKYLEQVGDIAKALVIHYDGVRYAYLDKKVMDFNLESSHKELAVLHPILPPHAKTAIQRLGILVESEDVAHHHYFRFFYFDSEQKQSAEDTEQKKQHHVTMM